MCQVILEKHTGYLTVILQGELILGCTSEVKEKVKNYAEENQIYHMLIDLSQVSFMDSSGLGALIAWFKMANQHQGKVIFCGFTDYVRKIVGYAKLDKIFAIADTRAKAEELLRG